MNEKQQTKVTPAFDWQDIEGHFNFQQIYSQEVAKAQDGDNFLEIGCFLGRSTSYLAQAIKASGKNITIHVIDTFEGTGYKPIIPFIETFKNNMKACGVLDIIKIYEGTSDFYRETFEDEFFDFIYVDGDHENIELDILNYLPKVKKGKTFAGHDYQHPTVAKFVNKLLGLENILFQLNTWIFTRKIK